MRGAVSMGSRGAWRASVLLVCAALPVWPTAGLGARRRKANPRARHYEAALQAGRLDEAFDQVLAALGTPTGAAEMDALAAALASRGDKASSVLRSLLGRESPLAPGATAELLWRVSGHRRFTDGYAALAAELLTHDDPMVRGLADWAIGDRIGRENSGARIAWPRPDPPAWYRRWEASLTPEFAHTWDTGTYTGQWLQSIIESHLKSYQIRLKLHPSTVEDDLWDEAIATSNTKTLLLKWTRSTNDYIQIQALDCQITRYDAKIPQAGDLLLDEIDIVPRSLSVEVKDSIADAAGGIYGD